VALIEAGRSRAQQIEYRLGEGVHLPLPRSFSGQKGENHFASGGGKMDGKEFDGIQA
jgi:hypothetical protein